MSTAVQTKPLAYHELSEEAQTNARKLLAYDGGSDGGELYDIFSMMVSEDVQENLGEDDFMSYWGFPEFKVHWDLSFCQGSGIGFEGSMDATEVTNEDWRPILAMLGANCEHHVVSGHKVSWPRPITRMTIRVQGDNPWFNDHMLDLIATYVDENGDEDEEDELDQYHPIFQAVSQYLSALSNKLYRTYSDELLNADEDLDRVASFFEWQDQVRFNQWGDRIDELDDDEIQDLEEQHA